MDHKMDILTTELKCLHSDRDTTKFGVVDFIHAFGSPLEAMMYARLFWPDFVKLNGMIFRSDVIEDQTDEQRVQDSLRDQNGNKTEIERNFNRVEVPEGIFGRRLGESSSAIDEQLASKLAEMWQARLSQLFSDLKFSVVVEQELDGGLYVTCCRKREGEK